MEQINIDIEQSLNKDTYASLKALLKLFQYRAVQIPSNFRIFKVLKDSILDEELSADSKKLILLYYQKYRDLYSLEELLRLFEYSLKEDNKCRTNIWMLEMRMVLLYNYTLPLDYFIEMINLFWDLKTIDKYLVSHIILAMLSSSNEENKKTIKKFLRENAQLFKEILITCSEGENISIISLIVCLIEKYSSFDFLPDIIDYCKQRKRDNE